MQNLVKGGRVSRIFSRKHIQPCPNYSKNELAFIRKVLKLFVKPNGNLLKEIQSAFQ